MGRVLPPPRPSQRRESCPSSSEHGEAREKEEGPALRSKRLLLSAGQTPSSQDVSALQHNHSTSRMPGSPAVGALARCPVNPADLGDTVVPSEEPSMWEQCLQPRGTRGAVTGWPLRAAVTDQVSVGQACVVMGVTQVIQPPPDRGQ